MSDGLREALHFLFQGRDVRELLLRFGLFSQNGIERPAVFPLQTSEKLQPLFDGLQTGRIEREALCVIAEGEGGILDPVVQFVQLLPRELQPSIDLSDLLDGRNRAAQFREHRAAFPIEALIGGRGEIDQLLDIHEDLFLFRKRSVFPRADARPGNFSDLEAEQILPLLPFSPELLKRTESLVQRTVPVV